MNAIYLAAMANLFVNAATFFISICRLNAMGGEVLMRVKSEYTAYIVGALVCGLQPWWGEWPGWGSICISAALLIGLLCSSHAWRHGKQDMAPDMANSDKAPLSEDKPKDAS